MMTVLRYMLLGVIVAVVAGYVFTNSRVTPYWITGHFAISIHDRSVSLTVQRDALAMYHMYNRTFGIDGGAPAWHSFFFPNYDGVFLTVPFWCILFVTIPPWFILDRRARMLKRRTREGRCPCCGYNLFRNESGTCPECGTPVQRVAETEGTT